MYNIIPTKFNSMLLLTSATCISTLPAFSQSDTDAARFDLEEIMVTAQRRDQNVQDVPIAITSLSGSRLSDSGVRNALDLTRQVPGLQINNLFQGSNPTIFLRGVGVNDFNAAASGAVGVTIDDTFLNSSIGTLFQLYDVDRVEVLKGPQGTLYGRNTTGGVINFYTKQPTFEQELSASVTYGRFDQLFMEAAGGGALIDNVLAYRVSTSFKKREGWTTNTIDGRKLNDIDNYATRLQFLYTPNDRLTISNKYEGGKSDTSALAHKSLGTFNVAENRPCTGDEILQINLCANPISGHVDTKDLDHVTTDVRDNSETLDNVGDRLSVTWEGDDISITSISSYVWNERTLNQDQDFSPFAIINSPVWDESSEQISQELRFSSTAGNRLNWVVGFYYLHEKLESITNFTLLREFNPNPSEPFFDPASTILMAEREFTQVTDSYAAFAQADYDVTDDLTLTLGLRYTKDKKDLDFRTVAGAVNGEANATLGLHEPLIGLIDTNTADPAIDGFINVVDEMKEPTWRLAANYRVSPDISLYSSYSRGVRAGGHNTGALFALGEFSGVDSEQLDSFEIGMKSDIFDRHVRLNVSAFFYDYQDLQVFSLEPGANNTPLQRLQNADAEIYGGEIEIQARPLHGLDINFGIAGLHTEYTDFEDPIRGSFNGKRLDKAPTVQLSASARYTFNLADQLEGSIGADYSYQSKVYMSPANEAPLEGRGHGQLDLDVGVGRLESGVKLRMYVKNVADKQDILDINDLSSLGFYFPVYSEPRTYGVSISYEM